RDFTVNAIAVPLSGRLAGELLCAEHAQEDLREGRLRVLHEGSFLDDPTRLLRLARYSARLGFKAEPRTAELASEALATGSLETVLRARIGAELRLALAESDAVAALGAISELGALTAIERRLRLDESLARRALALLPADGRPDLLLVASLLLPLSIDPDEDPEPVMFELLDGLEFTAGDRDRARRGQPRPGHRSPARQPLERGGRGRRGGPAGARATARADGRTRALPRLPGPRHPCGARHPKTCARAGRGAAPRGRRAGDGARGRRRDGAQRRLPSGGAREPGGGDDAPPGLARARRGGARAGDPGGQRAGQRPGQP